MDDAALDNIVEFINAVPGLAKAIAAGTVAFEIYWEELDGNGDIQPHVRITPKA